MKLNIVVNYISRLVSALSNFLFVPFYISLLGRDSFAIVALGIVLASLLMILDLGMSPAIAREMARQDIGASERARAFRAVEKLYFAIMVVTAGIGIVAAGPIAQSMSGSSIVPSAVIADCLKLMSVEAALQLMLRFHTSVLIGLERQVRASIVAMLWATARNGGVLGAIWLFPNLHVFFGWQVLATLLIVLLLKMNSLGLTAEWPKRIERIADIETLRRLSSFAFGMVLISLVAILNTQLDKVLVGLYGSAIDLVNYTLSAYLASAIMIAVGPIITAVQPRLTAHFTRREIDRARVVYVYASRVVSVLTFSIVGIVSTNPNIVMLAWIGDHEIAVATEILTPPLVWASAMIALSAMPYAAAVANGYTRFNNLVGLGSLLLSVPAYVLSIRYGGVENVAWAALTVQGGSAAALMFLVMRKFDLGIVWRHVLINIALPSIFALLVATTYRAGFSAGLEGQLDMILYLVCGTIFSAIISAGLSVLAWKVLK